MTGFPPFNTPFFSRCGKRGARGEHDGVEEFVFLVVERFQQVQFYHIGHPWRTSSHVASTMAGMMRKYGWFIACHLMHRMGHAASITAGMMRRYGWFIARPFSRRMVVPDRRPADGRTWWRRLP